MNRGRNNMNENSIKKDNSEKKYKHSRRRGGAPRDGGYRPPTAVAPLYKPVGGSSPHKTHPGVNAVRLDRRSGEVCSCGSEWTSVTSERSVASESMNGATEDRVKSEN